jgi:glycosyltransferase involved in cell wall biosynthesis
MRIGYFNARGPNNGIENWYDLEIQELEKRGHEVRTFYLKGNQPSQEDRKWMDVAHYHFAHVAEHYKKLNVPFLVSPHANDIWLDQGETLRRAVSHPKCLGCTYQSFYHREKFLEWKIPGTYYYLPMSARVDLFTPIRGDIHGTQKIIAGGRLIPKKGLDRIIPLVDNLTIFGDGPLLNDLKRLNPTTTFTGHLNGEQLRDLMSESWLYLFPSVVTSDKDSDGIANTLKEALLMELQVIASPVAGTVELECIHLLDDWSKESLTNLISKVQHEPNVKGREEILSIYSPDKCVDRIERIINEVNHS